MQARKNKHDQKDSTDLKLVRVTTTLAEKADMVLDEARRIASDVDTWADYAAAVFAQDKGLIATTFPDEMERQAFLDSAQYQELYRIQSALMDRFGLIEGATPKSGKFVVRVPSSLHQELEIEAKSERVSLNQLVVTKLASPLKDRFGGSLPAIVRAFSDIHDGYAPDRVVVDPLLNLSFIQQCRALGLRETAYILNHTLYDIRKSSKEKLPPTTKRTEFRDMDGYRFASEIAVRVLQRTRGVSLDRILCDPQLANEFDSVARGLADESDALKLRWAALNLRKTHNLRPIDAIGPVYDLVSAGPVSCVNLDELPQMEGAYVFYDANRPIYAGETSNLRHRISQHLQKGLPHWVIDDSDLMLKYFAESHHKQDERLRWLRQFINAERPLLNYQDQKAA